MQSWLVNSSGKQFLKNLYNLSIGQVLFQANLDLGTCKKGFGFGGTGKKSHCRQFDDYGEPFGLNDTIGCYLDLDSREIWYSKNGNDLGKAFTLRSDFDHAIFYPAVVLKVGELTFFLLYITRFFLQNAEMAFNFGESKFKYPPTAGFMPIIKANPDNVAASGVQSSGNTGSSKPKNNAPQAVIIEVDYCVVLLFTFLSIPFLSPHENLLNKL